MQQPAGDRQVEPPLLPRLPLRYAAGPPHRLERVQPGGHQPLAQAGGVGEPEHGVAGELEEERPVDQGVVGDQAPVAQPGLVAGRGRPSPPRPSPRASAARRPRRCRRRRRADPRGSRSGRSASGGWCRSPRPARAGWCRRPRARRSARSRARAVRRGRSRPASRGLGRRLERLGLEIDVLPDLAAQSQGDEPAQPAGLLEHEGESGACRRRRSRPCGARRCGRRAGGWPR